MCFEELDELPLIRFLLSSIRFSWREPSESQASECPAREATVRSGSGALSSPLLLRDLVSHQRLNIHQGIYQVAISGALELCFVQDFPSRLLSIVAHSQHYVPCKCSSIDVSVVILFWQMYLYNLAIGMSSCAMGKPVLFIWFKV